MLVVKSILPHGHEDMSRDVLLYMQSMAERHGFRVLEPPCGPDNAARIEITYPFLRDRIFMAILEDDGT